MKVLCYFVCLAAVAAPLAPSFGQVAPAGTEEAGGTGAAASGGATPLPAATVDPSLPPAPSPYPTLPTTPRPSADEEAKERAREKAEAQDASDPEAELLEEEAAQEAKFEAIHERFRIGPSLSLGMPHMKLALEARFGGLGFGVSYGYTPRRIGKTDLTLTNFEGTLRSFPFRNPFFTGVTFGQQNLRAEREGASGPSAVEKLRSQYVVPHLGLHFHVTEGFFLAHEIGFVLFTTSERDAALSASGPASGAGGGGAAADPAARGAVEEVADRYGRYWMPYVTFLRFGYYF